MTPTRTHEGPRRSRARRERDRLAIHPRRASNRRSRLTLTLERVVEHILRDSFTEHGAVVARRTKVNAGEDARVLHGLQRVSEAAECSWNTDETSDLNVKGVLSSLDFATLVAEGMFKPA